VLWIIDITAQHLSLLFILVVMSINCEGSRGIYYEGQTNKPSACRDGEIGSGQKVFQGRLVRLDQVLFMNNMLES